MIGTPSSGDFEKYIFLIRVTGILRMSKITRSRSFILINLWIMYFCKRINNKKKGYLLRHYISRYIFYNNGGGDGNSVYN